MNEIICSIEHYLKEKHNKTRLLSIFVFEKKSLGIRILCCTTNFAKPYFYILPVWQIHKKPKPLSHIYLFFNLYTTNLFIFFDNQPKFLKSGFYCKYLLWTFKQHIAWLQLMKRFVINDSYVLFFSHRKWDLCAFSPLKLSAKSNDVQNCVYKSQFKFIMCWFIVHMSRTTNGRLIIQNSDDIINQCITWTLCLLFNVLQ